VLVRIQFRALIKPLSHLIFKDLKVLELASVLAGPAVGMFFSELGATVIKIENPATGGDVTRSWKLPSEEPSSPISAYYSSVNWRKNVIYVDLTTEEGKQEIYRLAKDVDVIIANYKSGSAEKLGMDYQAFNRINPKIIYGSISGFPEGATRTAFDVVLQAESGFMSMNGTQESGPIKMPVALIDILAAHQLKEAILLALLHKEKTGEGSQVSATLYESALASLANQATNYLMEGAIPGPSGSLHPNIAPYGETFGCSDGKKIILAVGNNKQFEKLAEVLQIEQELLTEFKTNRQRVQNRQQLEQILKKKIEIWASDALIEIFDANDIPAGIIKNLNDVFADPHAQAMILEENMDGKHTKRVKTVAFKTSFQ
jgi:crotonobetainyl-CoA:carnitine CoA-transferase CaiB-like acyl-CoA transferase